MKAQSASWLIAMLVFLPGVGYAQHVKPSTRLLGFADFSFLSTERDIPEGFREGQVVAHLASELSNRVSFFSEASATATSTGFNVEVERIIVRYNVSDALRVSGGRFHTPIAWWNTTYHHGQWFQTPVSRPEPVRGGSVLAPLHFVGAMAEGELALARGAVSYAAGIGNGRGKTLTRAGDAGEQNPSYATTAMLRYSPGGLRALHVGVAIYNDKPTTDSVQVNERIANAHVAWHGRRVELIAEAFSFRHEVADSTRKGAGRSAYAQVSYRLPGVLDKVRPYIRWDRVDIVTSNPALSPTTL